MKLLPRIPLGRFTLEPEEEQPGVIAVLVLVFAVLMLAPLGNCGMSSADASELPQASQIEDSAH